MDLSAFVQENKRWLLGCLLGLVVFFVARSMIGSIYDPVSQRTQAMTAAASLPGEVYDPSTRQVLEREARELERALQQLRAELGFERSERYRLAGKSMTPDQYLGKIGRELKLGIQREANDRGVAIEEGRGLMWPTPTNGDQMRAVAFGLELLDETARRLFAANDAVRQADAQAMGLVSLSLTIQERRGGATTRRRAGGFDPDELVQVQEVQFEFESDEPTALRFLESLRKPNRTLSLAAGDFVMTGPRLRGDPVKVKGKIEGIAFKEAE